MAWTKPEYGHHTVDKAGKTLISTALFEDVDRALKIVNNWRSSHGYPLQSIKMTLTGRARSVYAGAVVAERRKRIPAIELKLRQNSSMQLSKMHDIGGCRAILASVSQVEKLVKVYEDAVIKNPRRGGEFVKKYDYITCPKKTGYRGVHLVYKYHSDSAALSVYNGLRIEIQLRSRIQHQWATAVETVDMFTTQALKSDMGTERWKRFFALAASAFASIEKRTLVPGTPDNIQDLRKELNKFSHEITLLQGFQKATEIIEGKLSKIFLLQLDSEKRTIKTTGFASESLLLAQEKCLEIEKENKDFPGRQVVLVSVESLNALPKAFPNFFLDITEFLRLIQKTIAA
ncbi:MAG TPA: RelA/SpoT domain-containing protein [Chthoniobacteraceae bacterium]|jgi:ppGpp synthetase/RelA/SpoT-type nucleotidyltranferase|nr:RelA/SpoT domain-containing protein [Chthoniobacteraceae bacterium]